MNGPAAIAASDLRDVRAGRRVRPGTDICDAAAGFLQPYDAEKQALVDLLYSDPALVSIYDGLNAGDDDFRFYEAIIGSVPLRIVDLGCGTGRFAAALAAQGHEVVGIDPAPRMLDIARTRPGGQAVRWVQGDASALPGKAEVDVVVMIGHVFQCLLTDDAVSSTLAAVRTALVPGGRLMFESRNPLDRPWERWTPDASLRTTPGSDGNTASARHTVTYVRGELVTFVTDYDLPGRRLSSRSTLRFLPKEAIGRHLRKQGFLHTTQYGDWSGSPFASNSRDIVVIAS